MIYERAVDRERIHAGERNYKKDTFLAGKSRRLYKTLVCPDKIGIARQTAPLNVYVHTPRESVFAPIKRDSSTNEFQFTAYCNSSFTARLASEHPVSITGQAFEQPQT